MDVTFLEDQPFFLVSRLHGESTSEETNQSTSSIPTDLPKPIPSAHSTINLPKPILSVHDTINLLELILSAHDTVLPIEQVPWIIFYRKNLTKDMVSSIAPSTTVHGS